MLVPLVFVTAGYLLVFAHEMVPRTHSKSQAQVESFKLVAFSAVTIFTTGQLAGMLVRNALVASAATLVALLVQLVWFTFVSTWSYSNGDVALVEARRR